MSQPDDRREAIIAECARRRVLPLVSPCPNHCRFCYERDIHRLYKGVTVPRMPATSTVFDEFFEALGKRPGPVTAGVPITAEADSVHYHNWSDFFSQGLSFGQIERLLKHNSGFRHETWVHTNGAELDLEMARELSRRFPTTLRLHFSLVTFNDELKHQLIAHWNGSDKLKEIVGVLCRAKLYLIHLNAEQTLADLRTIQEHANPAHKPTVVISQLHSHRLHPAVVKDLSHRSFQESRAAVELLLQHRAEFDNIEDIFVYFPSQAYMSECRLWAQERIEALGPRPGDLVLSSRAAAPVLEAEVIRGRAQVVAVGDSLGGTTDFTTTLTTRDVVAAIRDQRERSHRVSRVIVPDAIWWVRGDTCLEGGTVDDVRAAFPDLEVCVVEVPLSVRRMRLTLDQSLAYYARSC
jgi:hypothetical protein